MGTNSMSWNSDEENTTGQIAAVQRKIEKRRSQGDHMETFVAPKGTKLTTSFWGQAWCRHLERYCGYEIRLPNGRSYLRGGNVYNFTIETGTVRAEVAGSDLYDVTITMALLAPSTWLNIKAQCSGQVGSLLDLLSGKLGDSVMKIVTDPETGLFPQRGEIKHRCTCPDYADLCKHQAAVMYAIGVRFDQDPRCFFELRGVDPSELIASSAHALDYASLPHDSGLAGEDLSALFGIDLASDLPEAVTHPEND